MLQFVPFKPFVEKICDRCYSCCPYCMKPKCNQLTDLSLSIHVFKKTVKHKLPLTPALLFINDK